jgi:hypothetical protein
MSVLRTIAVAATAVVVSIPLAGATAAEAGSDARSTQTQHVTSAHRHATFVA